MIRRRVASALSRHCYGLSAHTHRYAHRLHPLHSTSPLYFTVRAFSSSQQNNTNKDPSLSPVQKKGEGGKKKIDYKKKAWDAAVTVGNLTKRLAVSSYDFVRHPTQIPSKLRNMWQAVKDEAHHYWVWSFLIPLFVYSHSDPDCVINTLGGIKITVGRSENCDRNYV